MNDSEEKTIFFIKKALASKTKPHLLFFATWRFFLKKIKLFFYKKAVILLSYDFFQDIARSITLSFGRYSKLQKSYLDKNLLFQGVPSNLENFSWGFQFSVKEDYAGKNVAPETICASNADEISSLPENIIGKPQVFIGVADWSALDLLAFADPDFILLFGLNFSQVLFMNFIVSLIKNCPSRSDFLSSLFQKNKEQIAFFLAELPETGKGELENRFWNITQEVKGVFYKDRNAEILHSEFLNYEPYKDPQKGLIKGVIHRKMGQKAFKGLEKLVFSIALDKESFSELEEEYSLVMTMIKKNSFLFCEENYLRLKKTLERPFVLTWSPFNPSFLEWFFINFRYFYKLVWFSSLADPRFFDKKAESILKKIILFKHFFYDPGLFIFEDKRSSLFLAGGGDIPDRHWSLLNKATEYMAPKNNWEIIASCNDKSLSSLKNGRKICSRDFLKTKTSADCIILHTLMGNNLSALTFEKVFSKARKEAKRVVLLERNKESRDFAEKNSKLLSLDEIIKITGKPDVIDFSQGEKDLKRNFVLVYDKNG